LRRFGLFLIHLQSKNKATLGNAVNSKPKDSVTQEFYAPKKIKTKQRNRICAQFKINDTKTLQITLVYILHKSQ